MNHRSIHAYTWVPRWNADDGARAIARAAEFGFGHLVIPLKDLSAINATDIARQCEVAGIRPLTTSPLGPHDDISSSDPDIALKGLLRHRVALTTAAELGARHMGGILYSAFGKAAKAATPENFDIAAENLARLAETAAELDVTLLLEVVNRYETNLLTTAARAVDMVRRIGAPNVRVHLDTFHMNIEEDDMMAALETALPYLGYFEIDQNHRGQLSKGTIDFVPYLQRLKDAKYEGLIGVEAFSASIAHPEVAAGVAAWRSMFDSGDVVAAEARELLDRTGF